MDQYNNINDINNVSDVNNSQPINNTEATDNIYSSVEHKWQPVESFLPPDMNSQKKGKKAKKEKKPLGIVLEEGGTWHKPLEKIVRRYIQV